MYELMRRIFRRVNLGIILSIVGLALAVLAFAFDVFGFRMDRTESRETSEAINALRNSRTFQRVEILPKMDEVPIPGAQFEIRFSRDDTPVCEVVWTDGTTDYLMKNSAEDDLLLEIYPEHLQSVLWLAVDMDQGYDEVEHGVVLDGQFIGEEIVENWECEELGGVLGLGNVFSGCLFVEADTEMRQILTSELSFEIITDMSALEDSLGPSPADVLKESEALRQETFAKYSKKFMDRFKRIEAAGGRLQEDGIDYESNVTSKGVHWITERAVDGSRYVMVPEPLPPETAQWTLRKNVDLYSIPLDGNVLYAADRVLTKCEEDYDSLNPVRSYVGRVSAN